MRTIRLSFLFAACLALPLSALAQNFVHFNEIENNGPGTDTNDYIELIGPAGTELNGCTIIHYNGAAGTDTDIFRFDFTNSFLIPNDGITDTGGVALGFAVIAVAASVNPAADFVLPADMQAGPDGVVLYGPGPSSNVLDAVHWEPLTSSDMMLDDPGPTVLTTNPPPNANNYLHVVADDSTGVGTTLQATNNVIGDTGAGWALIAGTPGAINGNQVSGSIDVSGGPPPTPTNLPPVIQTIGSKTVTNNDALVFNVIATDTTDNDEITLSCPNPPVGAVCTTVTNFTGVTNNFNWTPATPIGVYTTRFEAADNDGVTTQTITIAVVAAPLFATNYTTIWINEINYDPAGADAGEYVEVAGLAGIDLTNFTVVLYNGANGGTYDSDVLTGVIDNEGCGFGAVAMTYASDGIQQGPADAVALVNTEGGVTTLIQFLSYEGSLVPTNGPALGYLPMDIGFTQNNVNISVQLQGAGTNYAEFVWGTNVLSQSALNTGQSIVPCGASDIPPILALIGNKQVIEFSNLTFLVSASDTVDGDVIELSASNLPSGAVFNTVTNTAGVTNTFNWVGATPAGVYTTTFYAVDNDGADTETINITVTPTASGAGSPVWLNEVNYDGNIVNDTDEFVEVAGAASIDLSNWSIVHYNGANGAVIVSNSLSGLIDDEGCGYGAVSLAYSNTLQNGPDGVALVEGSTLRQFISYEGAFIATAGPALGYQSVNAITTQNGVAPSPQLNGSGTAYTDFTWGLSNASPSTLNIDQIITPCGGDEDSDGLPDAWETQYFGDTTSGVANADSPDADGIINTDEYIQDSDPTVSNQMFDIDALTINSPLTLQFPSTNSRAYTVEYTTNLNDNTGWSHLEGPATGSNGVFSVTDTNDAATRDYRVNVKVP